LPNGHFAAKPLNYKDVGDFCHALFFGKSFSKAIDLFVGIVTGMALVDLWYL
jgi:hypothetical protein